MKQRLNAQQFFADAAEREADFREAIDRNRRNIERMTQESKEKDSGPRQDTRSK